MSILFNALVIASLIMAPALLGGEQIKVAGQVEIQNDVPGNVAIAIFDDTGALVGLTNTTDEGTFQVDLTNATTGRYKILAISHDGYGGIYKWLVPAPADITFPDQNISVTV